MNTNVTILFLVHLMKPVLEVTIQKKKIAMRWLETDSMSESQCHGLSHYMQCDTKFAMKVTYLH